MSKLNNLNESSFLCRRGSYLVCGVFFILSALCFQFCRTFTSVELLILGRLLVGLASGLTFSIVPMYLTEIAPLELRGTLGVLCSMGVTGGVVIGQVFSLQQIFGTEDLWQFALSFFAILVIICYMAYPWMPESPKYLYFVAGRQDDAVMGKWADH
jgi:MFS transporter, SP family, solute carrier family 2 (facilitated glucose transporter), member 3